ncbi:MAG: hypothetical protein ABW092_07490 [Candidatus Thiodiazotropha sp.]
MKRLGINPFSIPVIGIDTINQARGAIPTGGQAVSFTYPAFGKEGAEYAPRLLRGEAPPEQVVMESVMVAKKNRESVDPIF